MPLDASSSPRERYPLKALEQIFEDSLERSQMNLAELFDELDRLYPNEFSYRKLQHMRYYMRDRKGLEKPKVYPTFMRLLKALAIMPFFWDIRYGRYISAESITSLVETGVLYPPEVQSALTSTYESIAKSVLLLRPYERLAIAKIALNSLHEDHLRDTNETITLSALGYLRLPTLIAVSLKERGIGDDYLKAANIVGSLKNDKETVDFAVFLEKIMHRQLPGIIRFNQSSISALAELCFEVCQWVDAPGESVVINPSRTYVNRIPEFVQALNSANSNVCSS